MFFKKMLLPTLILATLAVAPAAVATEPAIVNDDLRTWTTNTVKTLAGKGENGYVEPDSTALTSFNEAVTELLAGSWAAANVAAADVNYEVVEFRDTGNGNESVYLLRPKSGNVDGRGFFFVRPADRVQRHLVIQAPHPRADQETAVLGAEIFRASGARAFFFAGAHRCTEMDLASLCPESSDACEGATTYRRSDMAHNHETFFEEFNELVAFDQPAMVSLQLHGHGSTSPEFSVSDGSTTDTTSPLSLPNAFADELERRMRLVAGDPLPNPGNSCNRTDDDNFKCGTNSVQGRFINGSTNICSTDASSANGQFLHLELSHEMRDTKDATTSRYNRDLIVQTVLTVIPLQAEIGDRVWADLDEDGVQDPGEPGIDGVTVELYDGVGTLLATQTTRVGSYTFGNLGEGDYQVRVLAPAGYTVTDQDAGSDDADSDAGADGRTAVVPLSPSQRLQSLDIGLVPPGVGQIGDLAWRDLDNDGLQTAGEPGLGGVTVRLLTTAGTEIASTVTAGPGSPLGHGFYRFDDVLPGDYKLRFESPGWTITGKGTDPESPNDSNLHTSTGETDVFTIAPGEADLTLDAGFRITCRPIDLVPQNAAWKHRTPATSQEAQSWPANWNASNFNDAAWPNDFAPLGWGTTEAIGAPVQPAGNGVYATYARLAFEVDDPNLFEQNLTLEVRRDNGVIVFLNGVEILRSGMPTGTALPDTTANTTTRTTVTAMIPRTRLTAGTNVLAVQVHQHLNDRTDGLFYVKLTGTTCDPCRIRQIDLVPSAGTFIDKRSMDRTAGSSTLIELDGAADARSALLEWPLTGLPAGANILQADLVVQIGSGSSSASTDNYGIYPLRRAWSERDASWNQALPGEFWTGAESVDVDRFPTKMGLTPKTSVPGVTASAPLTPAGRRLIEDWLDGITTNNGVVISAEPGEDNGLDILSDDSATPPILRVIYAVPVCNQ